MLSKEEIDRIAEEILAGFQAGKEERTSAPKTKKEIPGLSGVADVKAEASVRENRKNTKYFEQIKTMKVGNMPKWLEFDPEKLEGKILALPVREDIDSQIAEHMIVELYSK